MQRFHNTLIIMFFGKLLHGIPYQYQNQTMQVNSYGPSTLLKDRVSTFHSQGLGPTLAIEICSLGERFVHCTAKIVSHRDKVLKLK